MNSENRYRELLSKLLDDECSVEEREELARLCLDDEVRRETLRAELEISELIRHAISDSAEKGHEFFTSVESRIAGDAPDFGSLAAQLINGEIEPRDLDELARQCWRNHENAAQLWRDLKEADLLSQATAESRSEDAFVAALVSRMQELRNSGDISGFTSLSTRLIDGELETPDLVELARRCAENPENAAQLQRDLKWADLVGQAATESRSEDAFVASLTSRMQESGNASESSAFASLSTRLIDGELESPDLVELARQCAENPENAAQLQRDLKWADLVGQATAESRSEDAFVASLTSRIQESENSSEAPAFASLTTRLIDGELETPDLEELARQCTENPENAAQLQRDLKWADLVGQAAAESRSEDAFVASLAARMRESGIAGKAPAFGSLSTRLIDGELETPDLEELARQCTENPENAAQLRRDLKWADLIGQATAKSRSEDAFVESLATRMWAEQEQDHFVEKTESKIVSMFPDTAHPAEKQHRATNIISIGTWATAAAAAIAMGAIFLVNRPGNAVAEIVHSTEDVIWKTDANPQTPEGLEAGHYALDAGIVTLEFPNGTEMTIEGPAEFDLRGENEAFVHSGIAMLNQDNEISADDPRGSKSKTGFTLQSPGVSLVDTHDTVGIDARNASSTEAVVFNGGAEICLPTAGNCRNLYEYEAVRVDLKRDKILDIPYNPRVFARSWEVLAGVERNSGSIRIELPGKKPEQAPSGDNEVQIFVERDHFVADGKIEVDTLKSGQFTEASDSKGEALVEKGALRSYLLQLWPEDSEKDTNLEASVTFDHEVVGVIYSSERLEQSDAIVGTKMAHNSAEVTSSRGLDSSESDGDSILLSDDRRTVNLRLQSGNDTDQLDHVRVLVALR